MFGAAVYDLYKNRGILSLENGTTIAIGFIVAFLCALFVVPTWSALSAATASASLPGTASSPAA